MGIASGNATACPSAGPTIASKASRCSAGMKRSSNSLFDAGCMRCMSMPSVSRPLLVEHMSVSASSLQYLHALLPISMGCCTASWRPLVAKTHACTPSLPLQRAFTGSVLTHSLHSSGIAASAASLMSGEKFLKDRFKALTFAGTLTAASILSGSQNAHTVPVSATKRFWPFIPN